MDRLDAIGDPGLREAALFVRATADPVTADELAAAFGLPRTVARARLERLHDAGLLVTSFERRTGRSGPGAGRPAKTYAAAVETEAIEFPQRRYESLVRLLVEAMPHRGRDRRLDAIGYEFGLELARKARLKRSAVTRSAFERLCSGLGRLGFHATLESVTAEQVVIASRTCPLRPLVVSEPGLRAADRGMWHGLAAAVAGDMATAIRCETHDCLDRDAACRIVVALGGAKEA